ncbi:hypothetical protein D3260_02825 [Salinisphaera sp. Q1T1-3]|nr:hypothetical protein D3260_02825 [Salinisphaera sp. Q1T1-3]
MRQRWYHWRRGAPVPVEALEPHLDAAADWIARAQDAGIAGGVPAYYDRRRRRWAASYPETTGYIIPTCYAYARRSRRDDFFDRATRMAHWESDVQLDSGAVSAGTMDAKRRVPTVFNTGQVLFGWTAAWQETREPRFAASLRHACDWLVSVQDDDGAWRRYGSPLTTHPLNTYNTRTALGLAEAGRALDEPRYLEAARANGRWALTQLHDNGWLENNDLEDNARPLTHTLGYALHGLVGLGLRLGDRTYVEAAVPALAALVDRQRRNGSLAGRYDADWREAAPWSCLTGEAQLAEAWLALIGVDDTRNWRRAAERAVGFVAGTQSLTATDSAVRGGIAGSAPIFGDYMTDRYPNWAPKFFMDAVMQLTPVV